MTALKKTKTNDKNVKRNFFEFCIMIRFFRNAIKKTTRYRKISVENFDDETI